MKQWENFTEEEQAKILKAGRSNCCLDTTKLVETAKKYGVVVPEVQAAMRSCFERMVALEHEIKMGRGPKKVPDDWWMEK